MRIALTIQGRVQGVGFRAWVWRRASSLGLRGWVQNQRDGSVSIEAEGSDSAAAAFRQLLAEGPPHARVDRITERAPAAIPLPDSFEIR